MCYSAKLQQDYRSLLRRYQGQLAWDDFVEMLRQREAGAAFKVCDEMVAGLVDLGGTAAREIELLQRRHKVAELRRLQEAVTEAGSELAAARQALADRATKTNQKAAETRQRKLERLQRALETARGAAVGDYRIYPFFMAPIIVLDGQQRMLVPARYRLLPRSGVEVPAAYNVFNARRSSLQSARNWKPLFGRRHALFPFLEFFEWVERDGGKVEISFRPDGHDGMHAAALYEEYPHPQLGCIRSFAMVTDEPPPEVAAAGHDRCPVYLRYQAIDEWLTPDGRTPEQLNALLDQKEMAYYSHALAA